MPPTKLHVQPPLHFTTPSTRARPGPGRMHRLFSAKIQSSRSLLTILQNPIKLRMIAQVHTRTTPIPQCGHPCSIQVTNTQRLHDKMPHRDYRQATRPPPPPAEAVRASYGTHLVPKSSGTRNPSIINDPRTCAPKHGEEGIDGEARKQTKHVESINLLTSWCHIDGISRSNRTGMVHKRFA